MARRGRQRPVRGELRACDRARVGVAVDAQHPGDVGRNLLVEVDERRRRCGRARRDASGRIVAWPALEQHLGLEHEAVADDADVGPVAEDLAQPPEEIRAVAGELLHPLRQRDVEPAAEVGDLGLAIPCRALGGRERLLDRGELAAQRRDLLVEQLDLGQRRAPVAAFRIRARAELAARAWAGAAASRSAPCRRAALVLGRAQGRLQARRACPRGCAWLGALQRQQFGQFGDLRG